MLGLEPNLTGPSDDSESVFTSSPSPAVDSADFYSQFYQLTLKEGTPSGSLPASRLQSRPTSYAAARRIGKCGSGAPSYLNKSDVSGKSGTAAVLARYVDCELPRKSSPTMALVSHSAAVQKPIQRRRPIDTDILLALPSANAIIGERKMKGCVKTVVKAKDLPTSRSLPAQPPNQDKGDSLLQLLMGLDLGL